MKYNIEGFDQQELVNMKLNSDDAIILRWFVDFYCTGKMSAIQDHSGEEFRWVNYQAIIDDLPILEIKNKQVIARHFQKMEIAGILKKYLHKQNGTYSCFKLTEKYRVLIEKLNGVDSKVEPPIDSKVDTKDSSIIINSSIISYKEPRARFTPPSREDIETFTNENQCHIDIDTFLDYYNSNGWKIGKNKMSDWKATVRNWHRRDKGSGYSPKNKPKVDHQGIEDRLK